MGNGLFILCSIVPVIRMPVNLNKLINDLFKK